MRYMTELNNWLARDVRDRQAEIRGVNARIENLRRDIGTLASSRGLGEKTFPTLNQYLLTQSISRLFADSHFFQW
jgi:hypothetical protein